jgi:hypothetical protein
MTDVIHSLWFGLAALCLTGALFSWIFRAARIPGGSPSAAIAGGMVAGILLGASVLGSMNSRMYSSWFVGGIEESVALGEMLRDMMHEAAALKESGVSDAALEELDFEDGKKLNIASQTILDAQYDHLEQLSVIAIILLTLVGITSVISSKSTRSHPAHKSQPYFVVAIASIFSGISTSVLLHYLTEFQWRSVILVGCCAAVSLIFIDTRGPRTFTRCYDKFVLGLPSIVLVSAACIAVALQLEIFTTLYIVPFALFVGFILLPLPHASHSFNRIARVLLWSFLIPTLSALSVLHAPIALLVQSSQFWISAVVIIVLSHDCRWLGAWIALRLTCDSTQKHTLWQRSGAYLDSGVGISQAALAGTFVMFWYYMDFPGFSFISTQIVLAALIIELCQPIRQPIARWMDNKFHPTAQDAPS